MNRTLLVILFLLDLLIVALVFPAQAQAGNWKSIATWDIEYTDEVCMTFDKYKNGTVFGFAVTKAGVFTMVVAKDAWGISGEDQLVQAKIDDNAGWSKLSARLVNDTLLISVAMEEHSFTALSAGRIIRLRIDGQTYGYELVGTRQMLPELVKCAIALRDWKQS